MAKHATPAATWENLDIPARMVSQLKEVCSQFRLSRAHKHGAHGKCHIVLFTGPSGTRNSQMAEVFANELRMDLHRIDLSAVVSKYIGETEKNLAGLLEAANAADAILFFDEADALLGQRSEVQDSHNRYANMEVSHLLQKLEDYGGLVILASNRRAALDKALLRRLNCVVEFPEGA